MALVTKKLLLKTKILVGVDKSGYNREVTVGIYKVKPTSTIIIWTDGHKARLKNNVISRKRHGKIDVLMIVGKPSTVTFKN